MTSESDQTGTVAGENAAGSVRFFLLCLPERQALYRKLLEPTPYIVDFFDDPEELVARCVAVPPLALLVDLASSVRIGAFRMASLTNLEVNWPILRIKTISGESPMVMSIDPPRRDPFLHTLRAISDGDGGWKNARFSRRFIRLKLTCRVRWRDVSQLSWTLGNTLNISVGGGLIASYEPPDAGARVQVEVRDLTSFSLVHEGRVVRRRLWNDSPELPAFGVMFDSSHEELRAALVQWFRRFAAMTQNATGAGPGPASVLPSSWPAGSSRMPPAGDSAPPSTLILGLGTEVVPVREK